MFWAHRRQPGNNPESHKLSGQVLLNDVPGNLSVLRIELQLIFMWSIVPLVGFAAWAWITLHVCPYQKLRRR